MDLTTFSQKYAADLQGTQVGMAMYGIFAPGINKGNPGYSAAWSDAPWTGWVQSGDTRIIDASWDGMVEYLAQLERENPDHLWRKRIWRGIWRLADTNDYNARGSAGDGVLGLDARMMHEMAVATGRTAEAKQYAAMLEKVRAAFQKAYVRPDGTVETIDHYSSIPPPTVHPTDETPDPIARSRRRRRICWRCTWTWCRMLCARSRRRS